MRIKVISGTLIVGIILLGASVTSSSVINHLSSDESDALKNIESTEESFILSDDPHVVYGFVNYSDGSWVPNDVVITLTNLENNNYITEFTIDALTGQTNYYLTNIMELPGTEDGHRIRANVSYGGCTGMSVNLTIDTSVPSQLLDVMIYGNLPPQIPSQPSGPTTGHIDIMYNYSTLTWDSDDDDIYYWFDWDDGNNSGWLGPYSSNETCTASYSWSNTGNYQVKVKAKDEHGAELGTLWSDPLNVDIGNQAPNTPSDPEPPDGATDIDINADLSWNCSDPDDDPLTYDVYFEKNDPTPDELVSEGQTETTYDPGTMDYDTHYYWKIVAWDNYGDSTTGPVWDFTTMAEPNDPPYTPSDPNPENDSIDIDVDADLSWTGGDPDDGDTVVYDVYLEAGNVIPETKVADDISETWFDPGTLEYETTYYWQIEAKDNHGAVAKGPVWHFTTEAAPVPNLDCKGSLKWSNLEPGETVKGSFTVENIGDSGSLLNWEVIEWPDWGTWDFDPEEGEGLTSGDKVVTVDVTVIAPNQQDQEFNGAVKIVNKDDSSDNCTIPVYLSTPKYKAFNLNLNLMEWLLEQNNYYQNKNSQQSSQQSLNLLLLQIRATTE
jgi:hypothetical protein